MRGGDSRHGRRSDHEYRRHVSRAMQSRYSHVRMEAKRRALDPQGRPACGSTFRKRRFSMIIGKSAASPPRLSESDITKSDGTTISNTGGRNRRLEEHTSELQSLRHLV